MHPLENKIPLENECTLLTQRKMQRTLVILKPEALENRTIGAVLSFWDDAGFQLVAAKVKHSSP
jgi:hypothetical protein